MVHPPRCFDELIHPIYFNGKTRWKAIWKSSCKETITLQYYIKTHNKIEEIILNGFFYVIVVACELFHSGSPHAYFGAQFKPVEERCPRRLRRKAFRKRLRNVSLDVNKSRPLWKRICVSLDIGFTRQKYVLKNHVHELKIFGHKMSWR